jgi:cytochrome c oxidase assembly protein subunit 15
LAIPDFPLSYGHLVPWFWTRAIALHFAHRVGALLVTLFVIANVSRVLARHRTRPELRRPALFLMAAVILQVTLGALVVLTAKQPVINTLHVATGATVLVTSLVLTLRVSHAKFAPASVAAAAAA